MTSFARANTELNATLTQMSMGPSSASVRSAAMWICSWSATSVGSSSARPPAARTSAAAPARPFVPRASSATDAPRSPYARATARPTPALAPVTTMTGPCMVPPVDDVVPALPGAADGEAPRGQEGRTAFVNFIRLMSDTFTGCPLREACTILPLPM